MPETQNAMLAPILALAVWTLVMLVWLYATRIPAMAALKIKPRPGMDLAVLPPWAKRPAANYVHLHEQPTLFYAVALVVHLAGAADPANALLAWAYVGLRIVHSLHQALFDVIPIRFALFNLSALVLAALTIRAALALV